MKITDVNNKLNLHVKDYDEVRKDVDKVTEWITWGIKIVLGAVILAVLAVIGLK